MNITKDKLDRLYAETFDMGRFTAIDPCGLVYELMQHTDDQLDIELGALFTAMITWGNRKAIRTAVRHMLQDEMHWHPAEFIRTHAYLFSYSDARNGCVYRTLNADTFKLVCHNIHQGLGNASTLEECFANLTIEQCIERLADWLSPARLGTPYKSACKRICMFLRWMVRHESPDLGLWKSKSQRDLYAVMDVHVCQLTAPILKSRQANWKACCELTNIFRQWNIDDPLRYDIALMTLADNP